MANEFQVYSDIAFYTNALERVQQEIGEEAASLRPKSTDMAYKSKQLKLLDWCAILPGPEIARPHTPPTMCAHAHISNPDLATRAFFLPVLYFAPSSPRHHFFLSH
ncbi:hypothetical protein [Absidia glauca]|uniref:Uncharacterized protein n=1 Tax=Absidia glauca TaxID=4829 RepID=A0A163JYE6_ABSGL|nr:hypothetical protein [Absidia glauca]